MYQEENSYNPQNPDNQFSRNNYNWDARTKKIKKDVFKEIKKESWKIKLFTFLPTVIFLFFSILTTLWILNEKNILNADLEKSFFLFKPWIFIILNIVFLFITIYALLNYYKFAQERQYHFAHKDEIDINRVPNFIVAKYKRITGLGIVVNWLFFVSLLVSALTLTFFLLLKEKEYIEALGLRIQKAGGDKFPEYQTEIIFFACYLSLVFLIFVVINIYVSKEKSRLTALFDLKNKFHNWPEIYRYQKIVHIVCLCVFVLPLVIFILVVRFGRKFFKR